MIKILVIDDDEQILRSIRVILERRDFDIIEASDGTQGLELLRSSDFDVVITDIFMPNIDGFELIQTIREEFPGLKIVAVSGGGVSASESVLPLAAQLGADQCLDKPFRSKELLATLDRILGIGEEE